MDGLQKVTPFKHGTCWYLRFLGCMSWLQRLSARTKRRGQRDVEALRLHVFLQPGVRPDIPT